ncbi:ARM repeat-containing protein [Tothia fuscella]|uniref:non-specific serine/threonine protein kinase n=1 Tax=Tothia fuscella TaxID=1048955 RepID=A0A9P4TV93_9PEZI|nr:ARM repeat-containing protein [Tothia fuscella]
MGQGYSLTTLSAGSATIDVPELADLSYEKSLGNARFMKCIRARHKDGLVIAKVVMKPAPNKDWDDYVKILNDERNILSDIPNAIGYHRIQQTSTTGYLVRQYIHSSLYDRMRYTLTIVSNRPFLDSIEKKWLAFQLLCAVRDCHARNIYHGDIKTENILVTSWNWLYLADFSSSYKPTYLPEDNPADFSFYFDTSGRRTCYLAPERFLRAGEDGAGKSPINWAMDIFSVGCVIAELFLETPIFSLSQLFKYRSDKQYDPAHILEGIKDNDVREMVKHMIQVDPQERYSADEYLKFWKDRAFPEYFYSFLHQYMFLITDPTSGRKAITTGKENLGEADERINRVYYDFDKISYFLGYETGDKKQSDEVSSMEMTRDFLPLQIDIPNNRHKASRTTPKPIDNGSLLFLTLVEVSLRSTARAAARLRGLELLLVFAEHLPDEVKLDRILPYMIELLSEDPTEVVKITALKSITQLLALVEAIAGINAYIYPEYLLPRLSRCCLATRTEPTRWLRATYASCLSSLASTASKFLDMMQALRADGALPTTDPETEAGTLSQSVYQNLHDSTRTDLMTQFEAHSTSLLTDYDSTVRRAFLGSISSLCVFFGPAKAADVILSHLNTYLNDKDWELKCAFFETIVGVAVFVGGASLEEFILPLMVQSLADPEEAVVEKVLRSFSAMANLGLFERSTTWELVDLVARFTMHPNSWVREATVEFIAVTARHLSLAENHGIIRPMLRPYLKHQPARLDELVLLDCLKPSLSRHVFDLAVNWATKTAKSTFWDIPRSQRTFSFASTRGVLPPTAGKDLGPKAFGRFPKSDEDEQWVRRLRTAGLKTSDDFKLVALREYIAFISKRKSMEIPENPLEYKNVIQLKDLGVKPHIIIFSQEADLFRQTSQRIHAEEQQARTIAEALEDASTPIDRLKIPDRNGQTPFPKTSSFAKPNQLTMPLRSPSAISESHIQGLDISRPTQLVSPTAGPNVASSVDSKTSSRLGEDLHMLQRKRSAINLIGRAECSGKANAQISTTPTNVFGQVEGRGMQARRPVPLTVAKDEHRHSPFNNKHRAAHNYTGNDPNVLKHLDSLYLDNFPVDQIEFGPQVAPRKSTKDSMKRAGLPDTHSPWRPDGNLVALMGEHTGPVNRVAVSPDHNFFITGSDDGTVKVWDTARLERNATHRARQTHKQGADVRVTSLTFIENTHCFVSTGSNGSVHVVRVDYVSRNDETQSLARYGKLKAVREYYVAEGDHVVWCEHFREDNRSVLILATHKGRVIALELRTMSTLYEFHNPVRYGNILTFCVDKDHHWLLIGTTHGVLCLWDLRFQLLSKSWRFPGGSPVYRISHIPSKKADEKVAIAGGTGEGEVTIWDLEKIVCYQVYRTGLCTDNPKGYKLIDLDDEKPGGFLTRFADVPEPNSNTPLKRGVRALAMGQRGQEDSSDLKDAPSNVIDTNFFFVTAGPDWKIRFWEPSRHDASMVVSGLDLEEGQPTYHTATPTPDVTIISETTKAVHTTPKKGNKRKDGSIVSMQQQHLLRSNLDTIMDVALLEVPYGMVVSVDRMGCVYVFS